MEHGSLASLRAWSDEALHTVERLWPRRDALSEQEKTVFREALLTVEDGIFRLAMAGSWRLDREERSILRYVPDGSHAREPVSFPLTLEGLQAAYAWAKQEAF